MNGKAMPIILIEFETSSKTHQCATLVGYKTHRL